MTNCENEIPRTLLRALRQRHGLSQLALATRAGVCLNTVSLAERCGRLSPRVATRLAAVLGVERDYLLRGPTLEAK